MTLKMEIFWNIGSEKCNKKIVLKVSGQFLKNWKWVWFFPFKIELGELKLSGHTLMMAIPISLPTIFCTE